MRYCITPILRLQGQFSYACAANDRSGLRVTSESFNIFYFLGSSTVFFHLTNGNVQRERCTELHWFGETPSAEALYESFRTLTFSVWLLKNNGSWLYRPAVIPGFQSDAVKAFSSQWQLLKSARAVHGPKLTLQNFHKLPKKVCTGFPLIAATSFYPPTSCTPTSTASGATFAAISAQSSRCAQLQPQRSCE